MPADLIMRFPKFRNGEAVTATLHRPTASVNMTAIHLSTTAKTHRC